VKNKLKKQKNKIEEFRDTDEKFLLIVLDACRHDVLKDLKPNTDALKSPATHTKKWVKEIWPNGFPEGSYITANPNARGFKSGVPAWRFEWNNDLNTVLPESVVEAALNEDAEKMVVHFNQPHTPHLSSHLVRDEKDMENIEDEKLHKSYQKTFDTVWKKGVKPLLTEYVGDRKVAITADHGEALGENNFYFHFHDVETVRKVPWLEYDLSAEEEAKRRLKHLGYKN